MPRQPARAWASPAAARAHLAVEWGEARLRLAEGALSAARERCCDVRQAMDRVYGARAPLAKLRELARTKVVSWFLTQLAETPPVQGADLSQAAAILRDALDLPVKPPRGRLAEENVRAELLRLVFMADPEFSSSPTAWAYFGIASKLDDTTDSGDVFRDKLKPVWTAAIRSARVSVAGRPPLTADRRAEIQADLRETPAAGKSEGSR